jgi:hypothetical protein
MSANPVDEAVRVLIAEARRAANVLHMTAHPHESPHKRPLLDAATGAEAALTAAQQQGQARETMTSRELAKRIARGEKWRIADTVQPMQQGGGEVVACCTMIDYFNARACDNCSQLVEATAFKNTAPPPSVPECVFARPRNRSEAVALAKLALAYLGVVDAHIDHAIARCETDAAAPSAQGRG